MRNYDWLVYTYKHRRAFVYVAKKIIRDEAALQRVLERAKVHDMDKMVMYLYLDQTKSQLHHVHSKPHHPEYFTENECAPTYEDLVEMIVDYECAPYTKPDKPLNAYDFLNKLVSLQLLGDDLARPLLALMEELGIASSYQVTEDAEAMAFVNGLANVSEEDILQEIFNYMLEYPALARADLDYVKSVEGKL